MSDRIPLDTLPVWAQDMILSTAPGLTEDDDAYAVRSTYRDDAYTIHAHGFRYTCALSAPYVY